MNNLQSFASMELFETDTRTDNQGLFICRTGPFEEMPICEFVPCVVGYLGERFIVPREFREGFVAQNAHQAAEVVLEIELVENLCERPAVPHKRCEALPNRFHSHTLPPDPPCSRAFHNNKPDLQSAAIARSESKSP